MRIFLKTTLTLFLILIWFPITKSFASPPDISTFPEIININNDFVIKATMDGLSKNEIYKLRIVLSTGGTTNYFGSTYNGSEWYNGTPSPIDYSKFLSITTDETGHWTGEINGKIESNDPNYSSAGTSNYDLKIGRYTKSGSSATWSNIVTTKLIAPEPTATPSPTSKPSPTPTKTPTPAKSGPAPTTAINILSVSKSPAKSNTTSSGVSPTEKPIDLSGVPTSVLGASSTSASKDTATKPGTSQKVLVDSASQNNFARIIIIIGSVFLITSGGFLGYRIWTKKSSLD